jgi:hypothetical protein
MQDRRFKRLPPTARPRVVSFRYGLLTGDTVSHVAYHEEPPVISRLFCRGGEAAA